MPELARPAARERVVRQLLLIRDVRLYLLSDFISTLGDSSLWLAMAIWAKELTGSSACAGLVMFCFALGSLFSPLGGVIADRFRRRPLLIAANLAGAGLVLLILLVHGKDQLWIVYAVIFCYGLLGSVIEPAQTALLPSLVPARLLADANGAQQTLNSGLRLMTPLVGAGLITFGGAVVAEVDAATFLIAAASLLALRVPEPRPARRRGPAAGPEPAEPEPADRGLAAGFRFIRQDPVLRSITIALGLAMLAFGFTESAGFSIATAGLHHQAAFTGVLLTVQGASAVAGGLAAAAILRRTSEGLMTALALSCAGAGVLLLSLPNLGLVLAGQVLAGPVGPWMTVAAITAIQRRTPAALLGRVSGAYGMSLAVPQIASVGVGAALIAVVSYRVLLLGVTVASAAALAYLLCHPEAHRRAVRGPAPGPPGGTGAAVTPGLSRCPGGE
jgi:predicted MFS family arabinose efflux permease